MVGTNVTIRNVKIVQRVPVFDTPHAYWKDRYVSRIGERNWKCILRRFSTRL